MKLINLIVLLCFSSVTYAQNLDCERFKEGHFALEYKDIGTIFLHRTKNEQTESGGEDGLIILYKVKWESPCVYTLKVKKVVENPRNLFVDKKAIVRVEIIETKTDSYIQRLTVSNSDFVYEGEIFIVK